MKRHPTFDFEQLDTDEARSLHSEMTERLRDVSVRLGIDSDQAEVIRMQSGRLDVDAHTLKEESGKEIKIFTGCWFDAIDLTKFVRIGISRGTPRGFPAGYKRYGRLEPGPWFASSTIPQYLEKYGQILEKLDPRKVLFDLQNIGGDRIPVMCCYESPASINSGAKWCHRHLAAIWLEQNLGIEVPEVRSDLLSPANRFKRLQLAGIAAPVFAAR